MGRCLACLGLGLLLAGGCIPRERQSIGAIDPLNAIPAMQRAAQEKDQGAVVALVGRLNSDDPAIRFYAIQALQRITGQTLGYRFYDDKDDRRCAVERWRAWVKQKKT